MASPNWFYRRRIDLGLTREQVAVCLGVTAQAIDKWERDLRLPRADQYRNVLKAYRASHAQLGRAIVEQGIRMSADNQRRHG